MLKESIKALLHDLHLDVELETDKPCTLPMVSVRIFQHVARRQPLYQAMLKEAGPTRTIEDVMRIYFAELCQRFLSGDLLKMGNPSLVSNEIIAVHAAGSLLGLLSWWLNHEVSLSAEDMGTIYCQLMANSLSQIA